MSKSFKLLVFLLVAPILCFGQILDCPISHCDTLIHNSKELRMNPPIQITLDVKKGDTIYAVLPFSSIAIRNPIGLESTNTIFCKSDSLIVVYQSAFKLLEINRENYYQSEPLAIIDDDVKLRFQVWLKGLNITHRCTITSR